MAIKKFRPQDIVINTMRTHPSCEFFIANSQIYYNSEPYVSGTINLGGPVPVTSGYASLYEMNVDRLSGSTSRFIGGTAEPNEPADYSLTDMVRDPTWIAGPASWPGGSGEQYAYSQTAAQGLQGWWQMGADVSPDGVSSDSTDHDRDATCTQGTDCPAGIGPAPGWVGLPSPNLKGLTGNGRVLQFDGAATNGSSLNIGTAATWEAIVGATGAGTSKFAWAGWVKKTGDGEENYARIFQLGKRGAGHLLLWVTNNNRLTFETSWTDSPSDIAQWYTDNNVITDGEWHHIAITYDAGATANNPLLYIDGENIDIPVQDAPSGTWEGITTQDCIFGNREDGTRTFKGEMTQFAIWNVILTATDVAALYQAGKQGSVFKTFGGFVPSKIVDNGLIYPYVTKDGTRVSLSSVTTGSSFDLDFQYGDVVSGSYPLSASITRELIGWYPAGDGGDTTRLPLIGPYPADGSGGSRGAGQLDTGVPCLAPVTADTTCDDIKASLPNETTEKCAERDPLEGEGFGSGNDGFFEIVCNSPQWPHYWALKNAFNRNAFLSDHYAVTASHGGAASPAWIKDQQIVNLVSIPSTFYGSKIKPGTVSLKWFLTGTLIGELQDTKQNGELFQVTGNNPYIEQYGVGNVAGVVFYKEGFIALTGSWALNKAGGTPADNGSKVYVNSQITIRSGSGNTPYSPMWIDWGAGANDNCNKITTSNSGGLGKGTDTGVPSLVLSASNNFESGAFGLSFKGTSDTQVVTMFANARRGEANFSNNPTYLVHTASVTSSFITSSYSYMENPNRSVYSFASSSAPNHSASFKREVYISRIGIYDENKNLIGVATMADPVRKAEDEDLTFKLKLDI